MDENVTQRGVLVVNSDDGGEDKQLVHFVVNVAPLLKSVERDGKTFLVGPVVLARECVMNGLLYPEDELRKYPEAWNDRVVPVLHPSKEDGSPISANSPDVIAKQGVGRLYNTKWDASIKGLRSEVWLEPARVASVSPRLQELLAGNAAIDVSTGLFVDVEPATGTHNGKAYSGIARNHRPDHLALLPDQAGACSWADGAGFPRINAAGEEVTLTPREERRRDAVLALLAVNDLSHDDLRTSLARALRSDIGEGKSVGVYVEDVFDKYVVYEVTERDAQGNETSAKLYKRDYTVGSNDQVTLADSEAEEVKRSIVYKPVASTGDNSQPVVTNDPDDEHNAPNEGEGGKQMDRTEMIAALTANEAIGEDARKHLDAMSDEQVAWMHGAFCSNDEGNEEQEQQPEQEPEQEEEEEQAPEVNALDLDAQQYGKALYMQERQKLITGIQANKQNAYTAEELGGMKLDALKKLHALAVRPTHKGKSVDGGPVVNSDPEVNAEPALPLPSFGAPAQQ